MLDSGCLDADVEQEQENVCAIFPDVVERFQPQLCDVVLAMLRQYLSENVESGDECLFPLIDYALNLDIADIGADDACRSRPHRSSSSPPPSSSSSLARPRPSPKLDTALRRALIHIDHMHSPKTYFKFLRQACAETTVMGHLTTWHNVIYLVIVGEPADVGEFLKRLRTQHVDLDARGRPCKERMAKVLVDDVVDESNEHTGAVVAPSPSSSSSSPASSKSSSSSATSGWKQLHHMNSTAAGTFTRSSHASQAALHAYLQSSYCIHLSTDS
ncbi:hypothetical protein PTSG_02011 [Salpingoeca rosetta]|uniref:Uncharacterized protein n=1 Tax=Salpingoeca rosetta (strain ATCC 50818 / BSB-021) TaxID=946362 RepID=F2TZL9_SALR5|nr:uncharacterized protein PTSG_02011 [Salpingoeca rosetta]EGD79043.1 hypothetical protein PTSG_02011 [Salpingoeca rosetta]|eukprot:XP_004997999.1 hypothetical protein PTSG_02011 [Salpingoeca rosetta]